MSRTRIDPSLLNNLSAALYEIDGTVAAPSWSFSADTDCGLYRIGANDIALATNGIKQLEISTTAITAALPLAMSTNKITGLANGSASSDAAAFGQIPVITAGSITSAGVPILPTHPFLASGGGVMILEEIV
jgi:hypothetical protein